MPNILERIIPFVLAGIALVAFAFGLILLAYLFLIGAAVGLVLFIVTWIRQQILLRKIKNQEQLLKKKKTGRIIDSDDYKSL